MNVTRSPPPLTRLSSCNSSCASPSQHAAVTRMARGFRYRPGPSQGAKAAWPPPPHDPSRRLSGSTRRRGASSEIPPRDSRPYEIRVVRYCGIHRDGCVSLGRWPQASSEHRDGNDSEMSDTPSANNPLPAPSVSADSAVSEAQGAASSSRQASSEHHGGNDSERSNSRHKIDAKFRSPPRRRGAGVPRRGALHPGVPPAAGAGQGPWLAGA